MLRRFGNAGRQRLMAFEPHAGINGALRSILVLPKNQSARQHVSVLRRLPPSPDNLPTIVTRQFQRDRILLVVDWINGPTLYDHLRDIRRHDRKRPGAYQAFRLFRGLAHGLSQLHQRCQIRHGDIKPENLILARDRGRLIPIDFGSAWTAERTTTRDHGDGISPAYSAPELQMQEGLVDFRADQFSASVAFYELLTLKLPYQLGGKAGLPQFIKRTRGKLIPPSRVSPDRGKIPKYIWDGIDHVATTGLSFDPNERFASPSIWRDAVDEVYSDLEGRSPLSPINRKMTGVIEWFADRFATRVAQSKTD